MGRGLVYVALPVLAVLAAILVFAVIGWQAAQRDRRKAIDAARWEFYSEPARGGQVAYGTRKVARYGTEVLILQDDEAGRARIDDERAKLDLATTAQQWTAFNNGLLPRQED